MPEAVRATKRKLAFGFGVALVVCGLTFAIALARSAASEEDARAVAHTEGVLTAIDELTSVVQDGERSQRGYLLTGDLDYLEPYETTHTRVPRAVSALRVAVGDDAVQRERVDRLELAVGAKFDELGETIALARVGDREGALAVVRTNRGARLTDEIRAIAAEMQGEERDRLEARRAGLERSSRHTRLTIVALGLLLVLTTCAAFAWVRRDLERRAATERRLRETNARLAEALDQVKELGGILPICSYCQRIRDDENYWEKVDEYIQRHTEARFSHGICPACYDEHVRPQLDALERESHAPPHVDRSSAGLD